jgi:hypothetical protein
MANETESLVGGNIINSATNNADNNALFAAGVGGGGFTEGVESILNNLLEVAGVNGQNPQDYCSDKTGAIHSIKIIGEQSGSYQAVLTSCVDQEVQVTTRPVFQINVQSVFINSIKLYIIKFNGLRPLILTSVSSNFPVISSLCHKSASFNHLNILSQQNSVYSLLVDVDERVAVINTVVGSNGDLSSISTDFYTTSELLDLFQINYNPFVSIMFPGLGEISLISSCSNSWTGNN